MSILIYPATHNCIWFNAASLSRRFKARVVRRCQVALILSRYATMPGRDVPSALVLPCHFQLFRLCSWGGPKPLVATFGPSRRTLTLPDFRFKHSGAATGGIPQVNVGQNFLTLLVKTLVLFRSGQRTIA